MSNKYRDFIKHQKDVLIFSVINVSVCGAINNYFNPENSWHKLILFFILPGIIIGTVYSYFWRRRYKKKQDKQQQQQP
jgi:positive regulator of sigma E activity